MTAGLQVRALNKSFGGIVVAKDIDFDLQPGARTALIGPNGAGKSTFANLITGILPPTSGEIRTRLATAPSTKASTRPMTRVEMSGVWCIRRPWIRGSGP